MKESVGFKDGLKEGAKRARNSRQLSRFGVR